MNELIITPPKADTAVHLSPDLMLAEDMAEFFYDPVGFAEYAFPWGKGQLSHATGLRRWQKRYLKRVAKEVLNNNFDGITAVPAIRMSTASGHGIGKSALVAIIILWIMSTRPYCKGTVTANTSDQLRTKTWGELGKWHKMCITRHWFTYNNSKGNMNLYHNDYPENWRCDAQTCREENSESFAGQHAASSTSFYIFDEASAVPDKIFEVAEGGLVRGEPMMFKFGNPTRNTGRFRETHGRLKHRWITQQIDSRDVEGSNLDLINEWIEDFGIDSDFVKVRVLGMFPSASDNQFISTDIIDACANMPDPALSLLDPLIVSVDVARSGSDLTVIRFRKGRDARSMKPIIWRGATDTMDIASKIAEIARGSIHTLNEKPDAIFIDGGGVGGGVVDRCKQLGVEVIEVNGQSSASNPYCANMRASMWWNAREAMGNGIAIDPKDLALREQLGSQEFGYQKSTDKILLITKEQMKKMGIASPDHADAFVQSFSYTVHREAPRALDGQSHALNANMVDHGDGQVSH